MRARLTSLVALIVVLTLAPAAHAATFTVTNENDAGAGSLRQALADANANGEVDSIEFAAGVDTIDVASTLMVDDPGFAVVIRGPVLLRWTGAAGPLLRFALGSAGSSITDVTIDGGTTAGIDVRDSGITIRRVRISGSDRYGVELNDNAAVITASPIFGNASAAIAESPVSAPSGLRVGPRQADGSLPVTGSTAAGGTLELFRGNPAANSPIALLASASVSAGSFSRELGSEPQPGTALSATITSGGGTSAFATTTVPFDVQSPDLVGAVAISLNEVTLQFSEPLRGDSVQLEDFALEMAGVARPVTAMRIEPGGAQVTLTSSVPWGHGEAGFVQLGAAGSVLDAGGNASLAATRVRVAAAPGDLISPVASSLSIRPGTICLTAGRRCKRTGAAVRFVASEGGRAHLVLMRGNRRIGVDEALSDVGRNRIRFSGRLGNRKLRPGRYRMLLYLEDQVGNMTVEPPLQLFTVRRSTP